jgi:hypothetical protein
MHSVGSRSSRNGRNQNKFYLWFNLVKLRSGSGLGLEDSIFLKLKKKKGRFESMFRRRTFLIEKFVRSNCSYFEA